MNTPAPVPPATTTGWAPTSSTMAGGAAGLGTIVVLGIARSMGHPLDEITASALVGLVTIAINYFHPAGGRQ